jgi:hypothetical protein
VLHGTRGHKITRLDSTIVFNAVAKLTPLPLRVRGTGPHVVPPHFPFHFPSRHWPRPCLPGSASCHVGLPIPCAIPSTRVDPGCPDGNVRAQLSQDISLRCHAISSTNIFCMHGMPSMTPMSCGVAANGMASLGSRVQTLRRDFFYVILGFCEYNGASLIA